MVDHPALLSRRLENRRFGGRPKAAVARMAERKIGHGRHCRCATTALCIVCSGRCLRSCMVMPGTIVFCSKLIVPGFLW